MKLHVRVFWALIAMALLAAACSGGDQTTEPAPSPDVVVEPASTEVAVSATAEVAPAAVATDDELIAAAVAQIEADVAAGQGPAGAIAYDLLASSVLNGNVTLTICAWDGKTVFDSVRHALYRTSVEVDGAVTASLITAPLAPGECLNTQLIDTAIAHIDEVGAYWEDVLADPSLYAVERGEELFSTQYEEVRRNVIEQLVGTDTYYESASLGTTVRADAVIELLFRRYVFEESAILELVVCRPMNQTYGLYKDGLLVDDERSEGDPGLHIVNAYQLTIKSDQVGGFEMAGGDNLAWSDCLTVEDWPGAANAWRPRDTTLTALQS